MYYFRKNEKILGPFNVEKLKQLAAKEIIERSTEISDDKISWRRADAFREIFQDEKKIREQEHKGASIFDEVSSKNNPIRIRPPAQFAENDSPPSYVELSPAVQEVEKRSGHASGDIKSVARLNYLELLWNPMEVLPNIYSELGDKKSVYIGLGMIAASALSFFSAIKIYFVTTSSGEYLTFTSLLIATAIPFASMFFASFITRTFLGSEQTSGGFGGDCLISGSSFLLASFALLISAYMMKDQAFFHDKGIFVSIALLVYAYTSSVLILYTGSTAISAVPKSAASIVVPLMIAITSILSWLVFSHFIMKQK